MAILLDSGILYAFYDRRDAWHTAAVDLMARERGGLVVPAPVELRGRPDIVIDMTAQVFLYDGVDIMSEGREPHRGRGRDVLVKFDPSRDLGL